MCSQCGWDSDGLDQLEAEKRDAQDRRIGERRLGVRCECGHMAFWHQDHEKCLARVIHKGIKTECPCVEYIAVPDRRSQLSDGAELLKQFVEGK